MPNKTPTISFIIPIYNESQNIEWHHKKIVAELHKLPTDYELVYVDDGSIDNSLDLLKEFAKHDKRVKFLSFSRNFGKEIALSAGLSACIGDAAIMLDADGQHPIELIGQFIDKWKSGYKVVTGVRKSNQKEGMVKRWGSRIYYKIFNSIASSKSVPGATDFRLLDRQVIDEFGKLPEKNRLTRNLIDWLGFSTAYIDFHSPPRLYGVAAYSPRKLVALAINGFVSHTMLPLRISAYVGMFITFMSFLIGLALFIEMFPLGDPLHLSISGTAFLALFLTFLVGIVLVCQGLLALYIENIHVETQQRPLFVVEETNIKPTNK